MSQPAAPGMASIRRAAVLSGPQDSGDCKRDEAPFLCSPCYSQGWGGGRGRGREQTLPGLRRAGVQLGLLFPDGDCQPLSASDMRQELHIRIPGMRGGPEFTSCTGIQ